MSWMKRAQDDAAPLPGPDQPLYGAPQHFGNDQNIYPNYQGGTQANTPQQQFWHPPQQQQPQYNQGYQHQDYGNNANQFYQQPPQQNNQFNPNYNNQSYSSTQQGYQQNYYQNQTMQQQNYPQKKANADSWEDNWAWGWEDSSKQPQTSVLQNQPTQQLSLPQQQVFNNANVIEESFVSSDNWNWSMDDKKEAKESTALEPPKQKNEEPATLPIEGPILENSSVNESRSQIIANDTLSKQQSEDVRTLNDRDIVKERMPHLALGKRFHLDNLTPQWSIESQMSQESSDGPHTHSESTYRSENQSRNSNKSSPGLNTESLNFNYSQSGLDEHYCQKNEWSKHSNEQENLADNMQRNGSRQNSHDELTNSLQEMSIANCENPIPDATQSNKEKERIESRNMQDNIPPALQPPPSKSPANFLPLSSSLPPPPVAASLTMPPPPPTSITAQHLPTPSSTVVPPPTSFPPSSIPQNPFKHAGPFSHKGNAKTSSSSVPSSQAFPTQLSNTNLTAPSAVSKVSQHNRVPVGFGANLETAPDNSERPDQPQVSAYRPKPVAQQIPDNMEVAPKNDRNEYLQTAHLSSGDYGENTDFSRNMPHQGLRRMVVGQQGSEYSQNLNNSGDEPPPGLARMVPGQQTETDNAYNQSSENYMDRHIDGQPTDISGHPYRQADGQQTPDNYTQPTPTRGSERRPIGLDRMVPGEPSNDEYSQYQGSNYASTNEHRVVTGVDHDYPIQADAGPTDIREQNVDGSDYTEQTTSNPTRNVIGAQEVRNDVPLGFNVSVEEQQRDVVMEGENLQDLSIISSTELSYSREQTVDGADVTITDVGVDRRTDLSDSIEHPTSSSRRQSINRVTSGEDSERDRAFKASPRRDRDKHKPSRDRDRDRARDGRYSRDDRKYERENDRRSVRDDRRSDKDRRDKDWDRNRRPRDESPDTRRHRRSTRTHRYETEDTDYYSDREKEHRRYREGSYTSSKPPRPDDKDRRYREDRNRRYNTIERDRRYDDERDGASRARRSEPHRERDRYERRYRDIDPTRKYGNLRREEEDRRRERGEVYSSPSRPDSREAPATDEELNDTLNTESRRRSDRHRRRHRPDPYYEGGYSGSGYTDPYALQRQQYQYYEHLRLTNPAAYMEVYKQLMAGQQPPAYPSKVLPLYGEGYSSLGYEARAEDRGSVHSGRSSTNGLKGADTYYGGYRRDASLRDAPSLRTDLSDRDLNTDASLNLHLEESTVRSERMTPFKFSTAHIKGNICSGDVVLVRPSYPVDGLPATVQILSLSGALANDPQAQELAAYPGPLIKGVTHKKSVIEYCGARVRGAERRAGADLVGYVLVWELLALLLRQNGVVVGADIAELLMKNKREYEYKVPSAKSTAHSESRRGSSASGDMSSPDQPSVSISDLTPLEEPSSMRISVVDEKTAVDRLREYLTYGNRQEALEWSMSQRLWGHALQLAAHGDRRTRAAVAARFLAALPSSDPLHTLYCALAAKQPPAATCVSEERWGDWRPHAAIILANTSAKPEQDMRTLTQLGDSLSSRGLIYSAQFCYLSAGVQLSRHPVAPLPPAPAPSVPRLALLLADVRATTLGQLATNHTIFATEIYEYALSLNQDYVVTELQVYKFVLACRLVDAGRYERALAYVEQVSRAVTRAPHNYSAALIARLAHLADRLKYHDPALQEDPVAEETSPGDSGEPSPRHQQWLDDLKATAAHAQYAADASQQATPQHWGAHAHGESTTQYTWTEQQPLDQPVQTYPEHTEETPDYSQYYQQQQSIAPVVPQEPDTPHYGYVETTQPEEPQQANTYADPYWGHGDASGGYGEAAGGGIGAAGVTGLIGSPEERRPMITMPGAAASKPALYGDYDDDRPHGGDHTDRETDTPKSNKQDDKSKDKREDGKNKGSGWFGGLFTKLSLRPPNQMILPDDKDPAIVWDEATQRWRNRDGDEDDVADAPPPPPKMSDLAPLLHSGGPMSVQPPAAGAAPPVSNIFKMQKGRHIKKSYVDVFNPSGAATRPLPPPSEVLGPAAPTTAPTTYFVPQPADHQSGVYDRSRCGDEDEPYAGAL